MNKEDILKILEGAKDKNGDVQMRLVRQAFEKLSEPSEITDEQAIMHLQSTGWMRNHDKEMYESGQKSMLADDSGSYDALIPDCYKAKKRFYNLSFLQPESECVFYDNDHGFCINTQDVVDNLNNQK